MALSTSERQARYRKRLKDAAQGPVLVLLNVNPDSPTRFNVPLRMDELPAAGDEIFTSILGEELHVTVTRRRFIEPGSNEKSIVLDCEGAFVVQPYSDD